MKHVSLGIASLRQGLYLAGKALVRQTSLGSAVSRDDLPLELCWGHGDIGPSQCLQMSPLLWHVVYGSS